MLEAAVFVIAVLVIVLFVTLPAPSTIAQRKKARLQQGPQKRIKRSEAKRYKQQLAELKHDFNNGYISLSQFDREKMILKAILDGKFSETDRSRDDNGRKSRHRSTLSSTGAEQPGWISRLMAR